MSAVHAFFTQRKKDLESGSFVSDTASAGKVFTKNTTGPSLATSTFHVAVQGCCHGELSQIYAACAEHERTTQKKIDLLICCGDFQAIRDHADLASMAVPEKYRELGDFHRYYRPSSTTTGVAPTVAPYLTLFVGGNHENSDWLAEESYGGFLAPNVYYLGHSGVVEVDGALRVAGLSGIFKGGDYQRPYPHRPYATSESGKRSAYHVRRIEVEKLRAFFDVLARTEGTAEEGGVSEGATVEGKATTQNRSAPLVDLFVSHDWPVGITKYGNETQLLRYKPFFRDDIEHNALGNPHTMALLRAAQPQFWLAAHLHCRFDARVPHHTSPPTQTTFIALDKCAKGQGFLDFIDVTVKAQNTPPQASPTDRVAGEENDTVLGQHRIRRDPRWVEVLRRSHAYVAQNQCAASSSGQCSPEGFSASAVAEDIASVAPQGWKREDGSSCPRSGEAGTLPEPPAERAVTHAASTAALVSALGLTPAQPLQQQQHQQQQQHTRFTAVSRPARPYNPPQRSPPVVHPRPERPGRQFPAEVAPPSSVSGTAPGCLGWFSDTGEKAPDKAKGAETASGGGGPLSWSVDVGHSE